MAMQISKCHSGGSTMIQDRIHTAMDLPGLLSHQGTDVFISLEADPYWKRSWAYTCTNRFIDCHEISYVVKGEISGSIDGSEVHVGPGSLFWMNARTIHTLTWPKNLIYYTYRFSMVCEDEEILMDRPFIILQQAEKLEPLLRPFALLLKDSSPCLYKMQQIRAYLQLILIQLLQASMCAPQDGVVRKLTEAQKEALFEYCAKHDFIEIDSAGLAEHLHLSRDYFSRIFKETFGRSARTWLFEEKMKLASRMIIDTNLSIQEIAEHTGYIDPYLFSRQFKSVLGTSPKQYREQTRQRQEHMKIADLKTGKEIS
jgi:AraC-like DNA-binding protein